MTQASLIIKEVTDPFKGAMKNAGLRALKFDDMTCTPGSTVKH